MIEPNNKNTIGDNGYPGAVRITPEGGLAVQMINTTGSASVKGEVAELGTTDFSYIQAAASDNDPIGVVYEGGIPNGELTWVVYLGLVDTLLEDGTACTAGNWVGVSTIQNGRADATSTEPPVSGTIASIQLHFTELGHCFESKLAGTDVLARVNIHFN